MADDPFSGRSVDPARSGVHPPDTRSSFSTEAHSEARTPFNALIVGAGEINFGSVEGPWNHSLRLERLFGRRLNVLAIIDPDVEKSRSQISKKTEAHVEGYGKTEAFASLEEGLESLQAQSIDLCIIGIPPHFRGGTSPGQDLDLKLIKSLPHVKHWLVEKPVSAREYSSTSKAGQDVVCEAYDSLAVRGDAGAGAAVVGVGYHFTALQAVIKLKEILEQRKARIMATQARYNMAYEFARKLSWYDKSVSCGPIVEQGTHLASLSLLFGGPADLTSVRTHTVEASDAPGYLSKLGIDESLVRPENRIPRYTSAVWRYEGGAVGSLEHSVALHGTTYDVEFTVIADGLVAKLVDLYTSSPKLVLRVDGQAEPDILTFDNDDPYETQIARLIEGSPTCTYREALDTYALTWAIRLAGEKERGGGGGCGAQCR